MEMLFLQSTHHIFVMETHLMEQLLLPWEMLDNNKLDT